MYNQLLAQHSQRLEGMMMSEFDEFKKIVSPIAYGLAYKSELGTTEYQQLYAEEDVNKYFNNKPQLTIPKSIADWLDKAFEEYSEEGRMVSTILTMQIIRNVSKRKDIEEWFMRYDIESLNLALAYLAGKALGVDLVKVVEG